MKKRILSLLLTLSLLLGLIPVSAQANANQQSQPANNTSSMQFKWVEYDNGKPEKESDNFEGHWSFGLGKERYMTLYYGPDNDRRPLENVSVQVTDGADVISVEVMPDLFEGKSVVRTIGKKTGNATIQVAGAYKDANGQLVSDTYDVSLKVVLPEFSLYDTQEFTEESLRKDNVYTSGKETTLWLLAKDGFPMPTDIKWELRKGKISYDLVKRNGADTYDIKLTIPADASGDVEFFMHVETEDENGNERGWGSSFFLRDTNQNEQNEETSAPVKFKWVLYEDNQPPKENDRIDSRWDFSLGMKECVTLYYGPANDLRPLTDVSVQVTSGTDVVSVESANQSIDGKPVFRIVAKKLGEATVQITDTYINKDGDSVTDNYDIPVNVVLPEFDLYTSRDFSESSMLKKREYTPGTETVLWILSRAGFPNANVTKWEATNGITYKLEKRGSTEYYDIKVTIPETVTGNVEFFIEIETLDSDGREDCRGSNFRLSAAEQETELPIQFKWVSFNNDQLEENQNFNNHWAFGLGAEELMTLYYKSSPNPKPLTEVSVQVIEGTDVVSVKLENKAVNGTPVIRLIAEKLGDAKVRVTGTYRDENNTPVTGTYDVPVSVLLPNFSLYTSQRFTEESLLKDWQYTPGQETTLWILADGGFLNANITQWQIRKGDVKKELIRRGTSDAFDIKLTIPADVTGDVEFYLQMSTEDGHGAQDTWGRDFCLRDSTNGGGRNDGNLPAEINGFSLKQMDWNGNFGPHQGYLHQTQNTTKTYAVFKDGQQIYTYDVDVSTYYGDNQEPQMVAEKLSNGLLQVTMTSDYFSVERSSVLTISVGDRNATFRQDLPTRTYQKFTYDGVEYTLALGLLEPGGDIWWGGAFGEGILAHQLGELSGQRTRTVAATVFKNVDTDSEAEAQDIAKKLFEHVEFNIGIDENDLFSFSGGHYDEKNGHVLQDVLMDSKAAAGTITATVWMKGYNDPFVLEMAGMRSIFQTEIVDCVALGLDTMKELQGYLDDMEAPEDGIYAEIRLAPVTYTGVLDYNCNFSNVLLQGATDENGKLLTTIAGGIRINNQMADIHEIRFVATGDVKIGVSGSNGGFAEALSNCSFEGYDIAVLADDNGMTYPVNGNLFLNNKIGLKVNYVANRPGQYIRTAVRTSSFVNNEIAVLFESVSTYSPYYYRITQSDFINNEQDIVSHVSDDKGPFYCYGNFFGTYEDHSNTPSVDDKYKRHNANEGNVETAVGYKSPVGMALMQMRRSGYDDILEYIRPNDLMSVDASVNSARVLNEDASKMLLDNTTFAERSAPLSLNVVNASGQTAGSWNFPANEALQAALVHYSNDLAEPDGFNAGLDIWYRFANGSSYMEVVVADNPATEAVLNKYTPTLTIPVDYLGAVVEFNGQLIPSVTQNRKVTFTVAESGTYTIYPSETPGVGLFYRVLTYDWDREGYCFSDEYPLTNWPISMAPYVDMASIAFFYSDGETVTPVEITIDRTTGYDYVPIPKDVNGNAVVGWYEMSPYDFTTSSVEYTVDGQTHRIPLETNMPLLAFYSEKDLCEETFRMYTVMDENPNAQTDGYKYCTTLYVNSSNELRLGSRNSFYAMQKKYNEYGNEIDSVSVDASEETYSVQMAGIDANGWMTVNIYSNIGDLLLFLSGETDGDRSETYGTYVNLLTPDEDSVLFVNLDTGFAAANFLPRHLFEQIAERNGGVTIGSNKYPGSVHYDQSATKNIMKLLNNSSSAVCLVMDHEPGTAPQDQAIDRYASKNKDIVSVVNLDLLLGNVAQHNLNGTATITYACDLDVPNGSKVDVYYLDSSNNVQEKIEGTYADGILTFQTTHFSAFAVTVDSPSSNGGNPGTQQPVVPSSPSTTTPNVNSPTVSTEKTENADGSTTVTEIKKDGTIVETTTNKDGSTTVFASKSETVTDKKTGETTTVTATNTTVTTAAGEKVTAKKVEETVKKADGTEITTSTTETNSSNGSKSTAIVDESGKVKAKVDISGAAVNNAAKDQTPVTLPMPAVDATKNSATAPTVTINVPASVERVKVEIPVASVTPGTVVVVVDAAGDEKIVPLTAQTEDGVAIEIEGDVTVKVIDNSKNFSDVAPGYTLAGSIDFVSARGLFNGTSETTFNPHANTTRGQLMTVLARAAGADTSGSPIQKGMEWAKKMGISDGTDAGGLVTRQQLATMLWRFAGCPVPANAELDATDVADVAAYAKEALAWCVEMGIMNGYADGSLGATKNASRAHVAAFVERYINAIQG